MSKSLLVMVILNQLMIGSLAASVPECRWVYDESYQAADICMPAIVGGGQLVDFKYECISETIYMNIYSYDSGCTGSDPYLVKTITDTSKFDCSKPICGTDSYAIWENHYAASACSIYTSMALITDTCLPLDDEPYGNYEIVSVYNDSSITPSFDVESVFYEDSECSVPSDCYVWSSTIPDSCVNDIDISTLLVSYGNTPNTEGNCDKPDDNDNIFGNVSTVNMDCNWVYWREWYHVIGICGQDQFDGEWYDTQIVCDGDGTSVLQLYYDTDDLSCSGEVIYQLDIYNADYSNYFECSNSGVCEYNYMSFRRYDSCNISEADINQFNVITNQCFHSPADGTNYYASCTASANDDYDGYRYGYDSGGIYFLLPSSSLICAI